MNCLQKITSEFLLVPQLQKNKEDDNNRCVGTKKLLALEGSRVRVSYFPDR